MRRLRLMGKEEQLLRETVRGMLQEVDPETEHLSKILRVPEKQAGGVEDTVSTVGMTSDVMGALANLASGPLALGINVGADIISVAAATYLMREEAKRYDSAMRAPVSYTHLTLPTNREV